MVGVKVEALEAARQLHADSLVVAMHTDLIGDVVERHSQGERGILGARHVELFKGAGIKCICDHVIGESFEALCFPTKDLLDAYGGTYRGGRLYNPSILKHALKNLEYMLSDLDESQEAYVLATSVHQIRQAVQEDRIAIVLCTEGVTPLEDEPTLLSLYHRLGVRVWRLATWRGNAAVGGARVSPDLGLSEFGKTFLSEATALRIVIDVSAISKPGYWDVCEQLEGPFIASRSNAYGVCDYADNLDDDQLRALAQKGGVAGLIANGKMVSPNGRPTLSDFVDHVDYIANLVGVDYVGIGPDIVEEAWYPMETYRRVFGESGSWSAKYPLGFSSVSELPSVTVELLRRGYSNSDVQKILGGNILRVLEQVW